MKIYPNSYNSRLWMSTSLQGCDGFTRGFVEYGVVDDDGGIMIAFCRTKKDADLIAEILNGKPEESMKSGVRQVGDIVRLKKPNGGFAVWRITGVYCGATHQEDTIEMDRLDVNNPASPISVPFQVFEAVYWWDVIGNRERRG